MTEESTGPVRRAAVGLSPAPRLPVDFQVFHELHRPAYVRWATLQLGNRTDAEEAVDQAFVELALAWTEVLSREKPAAYAWTVVKHRTVDAARARRRRETSMELAAFDAEVLLHAIDPVAQLEESMAIYQAIDALPERQRDVIVLRHCLGHTVAETADTLGISEAGVRSTERYARQNLRSALFDEGN